MGLAALAMPAAAQDVAAPPPAEPVVPTIGWQAAQWAALEDRARSGDWQFLSGGLLWRRIAGDGTGPKPAVTDRVTVHYAGTFVDGTGFDSSYERSEPATFPLRSLIPAWQLAIPQAGVGDTIEIAAPASMAYGWQGRGPIPGGATLLFKVELLAIVDPQAAAPSGN